MEKIITQEDLGLSQNTAWGRFTSRMMMGLLGFNRLNKLCADISAENGPDAAAEVLAKLDAQVAVIEGLNSLPCRQGGVVVANLPHGLFDLLAVMKTVVAERPNVKFLVNSRLADVALMRDYVVGLDDKSNLSVTREVVKFLRGGGILVVFPAEDVAGYSRLFREIADPEWSFVPLKFAKLASVPIIPLFIEGWNSHKYLLLSKMNTAIGRLRLPAELRNKRGVAVRLILGRSFRYNEAGNSAREVTMFARAAVYMLAARLEVLSEETDGVRVFNSDPLTVKMSGMLTLNKDDRTGAMRIAVEKGDVLYSDDKRVAYVVSSSELGGIGYYNSADEKVYVGRFRSELFVVEGESLLFSTSLIYPYDTAAGERSHRRFESHRYFEFSNKKIDRLMQDCVEVSNIYYGERCEVLTGGFMNALLLAVARRGGVRYVIGNLLIDSYSRSLGFSILVRFMRGRMWVSNVAKMIVPRGGNSRLTSGRFVSGQVRGVKRIELLVKLIREVEGGDFMMPPLVNLFFAFGASVASLGVTHTDRSKCNALLVYDIEQSKPVE